MAERTMMAVQLTEWGREPQLREVTIPEPTGTEVLIAVRGAGLCRSDLHVMGSDTEHFDYRLPMTLGHEVAGTVIDTGPNADASRIGDHVVVHGIWGCGECRNCARGRENYCLYRGPDARGRHTALGAGLGHHGGLAQAMLVPHERHLVDTGDLSPTLAAPLADAGLTAYHAISEHRELLDANSICAVIGVGGLGHVAVQILHALGVGTIVAVDSRRAALDLAAALGAARTGDTLPEVLDGDRFEVVFDFVGAPETVVAGQAALVPGGRLVVIGSAGGRLTVGKDLGLASGWSVHAPFWGSAADLGAVVAMARRGQIDVETTVIDLVDAPGAYRRLRSGEIEGRAVVTPPPLDL